MANVNDGSVVWSLNKINNAEQLNGLTAEQIKNNAINGKIVQVQGVSGSFNLSYGERDVVSYTIPLPNGFTRQQCAYIITEASAVDAEYTGVYIQTTFASVNQLNGVVTASYGKDTNYETVTVNIRYVVITAK